MPPAGITDCPGKTPPIIPAVRSDLFHDKPVLSKRYLAYFAQHFLFFSKEVSESHLAMVRSNEIDRFEQQLFFIVFFQISF
jgi:hypothetical protein